MIVTCVHLGSCTTSSHSRFPSLPSVLQVATARGPGQLAAAAMGSGGGAAVPDRSISSSVRLQMPLAEFLPLDNDVMNADAGENDVQPNPPPPPPPTPPPPPPLAHQPLLLVSESPAHVVPAHPARLCWRPRPVA